MGRRMTSPPAPSCGRPVSGSPPGEAPGRAALR
jgi:hypothetical protein